MQTCTICDHVIAPINLGLDASRPEERLASVEHILDLLIKSRYGMDKTAEPLTAACQARHVALGVCWDLMPTRTPLRIGRDRRKARLAGLLRGFCLTRFQLGGKCVTVVTNILAACSHSLSAASRGRGSPCSVERNI